MLWHRTLLSLHLALPNLSLTRLERHLAGRRVGSAGEMPEG